MPLRLPGSSGLANRRGPLLALSRRDRRASRGQVAPPVPAKGRGMTAPLRASGNANGLAIYCPICDARISVVVPSQLLSRVPWLAIVGRGRRRL